MKLKIATAQFPVGFDIKKNKNRIIQQMTQAAEAGAHVIHFPESALTGYPGTDIDSFIDYDWNKLDLASKEVLHNAGKLAIWVIVGSAHRLNKPHKPHNSLYIISDKGKITDRYDKLFCASDDQPLSGELTHFSSGDHFSIFKIRGVICSCLICHDYRYPELYRYLKMKGVELVFHSFYAGNMNDEKRTEMEHQVGTENHSVNPGKTLPEITMPASMISYAANNYLYISCSNTSAKESCWPAFMVRPDGVVIDKLERNKEGVLVTEIDTANDYYDATKFWRERAINGEFYSGDRITDERSRQRSKF